MTKCGCEIETKMVGVPYPMYVDNRIFEAVPETVIKYCSLHQAAPEMLAAVNFLLGEYQNLSGNNDFEPERDDVISRKYKKLISRAEGK